MTGELLIALVSLIVSGIISGLALWFSFREQRLAYRQTLYHKQLDIYEDVLSHVQRVNMLVGHALELRMFPGPRWQYEIDKLPEIMAKAKEEHEALEGKEGIWYTFLPEMISSKVTAFSTAAGGALYLLPGSEGMEELESLIKAYRQTVYAIRSELAIEPLSEETRERIGKIHRELNKMLTHVIAR